MLSALCAEKSRARPFVLTLDAGMLPLGRRYPLGTDFERFHSTWGSIKVDPEIGKSWSEIPALVNAELAYPLTSYAFLYFRAGLRRDIAAWHRDPLGLNLPLGRNEVDLNEPSRAYLHAESEHFGFTLGRFPVHWSPSPEFGLALSSSVPYHNGAEFALKMPRARFRFLVSSLNPWLEGTPPGDSSSEDYPVGSEEWLQRHTGSDHGAGNFHNRVYDERIKTLFAHRLEGDLGPLALGITETEIIGGKVPDLRDADPFMIYHNDFKDGYTNSAISLDAALRLPGGFSLAGEMYLDDVRYADTEGEGGPEALMGLLACVRQAFSRAGWDFLQSLHVIRTDPYLYGYYQPLNEAYSRIVLASNDQRSGDSVFVDRYVVDYPIGYLRGGDAFDFWYRLDAWKGARWRLTAAAALLSKGEVGLDTPYESFYSVPSHDSPTGIAEREVRISGEVEFRCERGLSLRAGAGWQGIRDEGHVRGKDASRTQMELGGRWAIGSGAR